VAHELDISIKTAKKDIAMLKPRLLNHEYNEYMKISIKKVGNALAYLVASPSGRHRSHEGANFPCHFNFVAIKNGF